MGLKINVTRNGYKIVDDSGIDTYQRKIFEELFPCLDISYRNDTEDDTALIFVAKFNYEITIDEELQNWHMLNAEEIKGRIETTYDKVKKWYLDIPTSYAELSLPAIE